MQAAILIEKLKIFPGEIEARNAVARRYEDGLADVVGALPKALLGLGHEVLVVMPKYVVIDTANNPRPPAARRVMRYKRARIEAELYLPAVRQPVVIGVMARRNVFIDIGVAGAVGRICPLVAAKLSAVEGAGKRLHKAEAQGEVGPDIAH